MLKYNEGENIHAMRKADGAGPGAPASRQPDMRTILDVKSDDWSTDKFPIGWALLQNSDFGRFTSWIHAVRRAA